MSSYTIDHKYGSRYALTRTAGELKYCNSLGVFNKTIIPLALVGYEMVTISYSTRTHGIVVCNDPRQTVISSVGVSRR